MPSKNVLKSSSRVWRISCTCSSFTSQYRWGQPVPELCHVLQHNDEIPGERYMLTENLERIPVIFRRAEAILRNDVIRYINGRLHRDNELILRTADLVGIAEK